MAKKKKAVKTKDESPTQDGAAPSGLVKMQKGDRVSDIHPSNVEDYLKADWKKI